DAPRFVRAVALPDDRGLVAARGEMTVQAVRRDVELAIGIPPDVQVVGVERRVLHFRVRLDPVEPLAYLAPEPGRIAYRLGVVAIVAGAVIARVGGKCGGNGMQGRHDFLLDEPMRCTPAVCHAAMPAADRIRLWSRYRPMANRQ